MTMTMKGLREFVREVDSYGLVAADLDTIGARGHFNTLLDEMDKSYGKNEKLFLRRWKDIIALLKQARFRKETA